MKFNINNTELFMTAGLDSQLPGKMDMDVPQVVMCGRSNAGKSSLINKMLCRKKLARVSGEPGKTITLNAYDVDNKIYLVDLPGYGFSKRSNDEKNRWRKLTDKYFSLDIDILCLLLVDLKVGLTKDDETMVNFFAKSKIPFAVIATKADKLNKTNREKCLHGIENNNCVPQDAAVIPFSSVTGEGTEELWNIIYEFYEFVKNSRGNI